MKHELIERYIYAVTRLLPQKIRAEVEMELDSLIADMLNERCGPILPTDKDIRVVLTELGTPEEMAAQYSGEDQKALISGAYFAIYKRVLKIVLPIVGIATPCALVIAQLLEPPSQPFFLIPLLIGQIIGGTMAGVFQGFAIITFIFAILERYKADLGNGDFFASLPMVPKKTEQIKPYEPIIGLIFSIIGVAIFLGFPQICGIYIDNNTWLPILNVVVIRSLWLPIILWAVLAIIKETMRLIEGRYTVRLMVVVIIVNVFALVCSGVVLMNTAIINPEFFAFMTNLISGDGAEIVNLLIRNSNVLMLAVICFALLLDCVVTVVKTVQTSQS
ncbi:MAG: hypothetical protein LBU61_02785 [Coriobacteriales bacterium]|jgi:hypothetical protein|nr:hypothetical protein [Coriobacteriales bacterium]